MYFTWKGKRQLKHSQYWRENKKRRHHLHSSAPAQKKKERVSLQSSNMAAARRLKRVVASQPGFLNFKSSSDSSDVVSSRRKRVNKNKKKNWNKHSDINDVDAFLEDVRHQERTTGGLLSEKSDDSLFFLDVGQPKKAEQKAEPVEEKKKRKGKASRPLRIDLILQHDSLVPPPKDVLAYQQPNAKKLRRIAQKAEQLAAKGVVPRRQKQLLNRRPLDRTAKKAVTEANNNPDRDYYDMWGQEYKDAADPWYLQQTGKKRVKRPEKLNEKPSVLPAVEVIAPGGSYNPDFFSHQALLQEAHEVEVKKQKEADKIERQLAVNREDTATEETVFREQVEGLVEEENEEEAAPNGEEGEEEDVAVGAISLAEKKTERQRKRERAEKIKEQRRLASRRQIGQHQQLFQLRSIKASIKQQDQKTKAKQKQRKANQEAQKAQPRRLGKLKFQAQDLEVQLSDELAGSLRRLKPEGSVLKDRFKSLQKRNLIEPRERAKFKRRHKLKYVEKRAFREIT
ncbi:ribosome biogenesis protein NOP53 isoform X2 [Siniperca chuatsi]|uniref:ribosome biogenesis protein NOP53 isoform X2 n=1 Tax=Siniperca chuatsi TaxID=119488 RepID=UPI001CE1D727|nr:ribosome biogenesis protein NOP53 isoform X2 [Siniperca chuatsi]